MAYVLIVDDDTELRDTIHDMLDLEQCDVRAAANGAEALAAVVADPPGVVLLDMRMPVMDGWTFMHELRARRLAVPVIVMTAAEDAQRWAAEVGADDYLAKPFHFHDLMSTVTRFVVCPPPTGP